MTTAALTTFGLFLVMYMLTTIYTVGLVPEATENFRRFPWATTVVVLNVLAIANIPRCVYHDQPGQAFASSCATILAFVFLFSLALYPNLLTASDEPAHSVTLFNAASSSLTLTVMLIIAGIGLPLVLAYTAAVYYTF